MPALFVFVDLGVGDGSEGATSVALKCVAGRGARFFDDARLTAPGDRVALCLVLGRCIHVAFVASILHRRGLVSRGTLRVTLIRISLFVVVIG